MLNDEPQKHIEKNKFNELKNPVLNSFNAGFLIGLIFSFMVK